MKKNLVILLSVFFIIVIILAFIYFNYQKNLILAQKNNKDYEKYIKDTIIGSDVMTLINKAIDQNEKNEIPKDTDNKYKENNENSIKIQVKFLESDKIYDMESIANLGAQLFVKNYNSLQFEAKKIEYHNNKNIKYILFEQI